MNFLHYPVMSKEVLEIFQATAKKLFVDCTVGGGGHSFRILSAFPQCRVIAIDQDEAKPRPGQGKPEGFRPARAFPRGHFPATFLKNLTAGAWPFPGSWWTRESPPCS